MKGYWLDMWEKMEAEQELNTTTVIQGIDDGSMVCIETTGKDGTGYQ